MTLQEQLVDTWRIAARITLYLLDAIDDAWLSDVAPTKGRSVGEQFAHLHNVRLMWLKSAAPELLDGLEKIEKDGATDRAVLRSALERSAEAVAALVERSAAGSGTVRGFKPHVSAFVGYLVSHEAHHRGQILVAMKGCGHRVDQKVAYGIWEWGVR